MTQERRPPDPKDIRPSFSRPQAASGLPAIRWTPAKAAADAASNPATPAKAPLDAPMSAEEHAWWENEYWSVAGKRAAWMFPIYTGLTLGGNLLRDYLADGVIADPEKTIAMGLFVGIVWTWIVLASMMDKERDRRLRERRLREALMPDAPASTH